MAGHYGALIANGDWTRIDFIRAAIRDGRMMRAARQARIKAAREREEGK